MALEPTNRRRLLKGIALAGTGLGVSLAGCTGQGPGSQVDESPSGEGTPTNTATPRSTTATGDPVVTVTSHTTLGEILADAGGATLYMFENDEGGESVCYDDCASAWPPLTVETEDAVAGGPDVTADLGTAERDDGSLQVTAHGMPLYYFARDDSPGDATGQEVGNVWFVLRPDGSVVKPTVSTREHDELGELLTDADGMTLYMFEPDETGESTCYDDCAEAWPPLEVEDEDAIVESVEADVTLGTTERDGGSLQVTAGEWPLYYFARDDSPGDATGQGVNDVWFVLRPDGTVVRPTPTSTPTPTPTPTPTDTPSGGDTGGGGGGGYGY